MQSSASDGKTASVSASDSTSDDIQLTGKSFDAEFKLNMSVMSTENTLQWYTVLPYEIAYFSVVYTIFSRTSEHLYIAQKSRAFCLRNFFLV